MATAQELNIDTSATAMQMAEAIFGSGITITGASYEGGALSSGIYTDAHNTIPGVSGTDSGVILSTGRVADFTNDSGTTDTNINPGTSSQTPDGVHGDPGLNELSGGPTFDGAFLNATFVPEGNMITMNFVFASEEYPEYVGSGFNDVFGVWVNGNYVPVEVAVSGKVTVDTVNADQDANLYRDNNDDQYNTEMDGFTVVLTIRAPVNVGEENTIRIGIADGGDDNLDSNLLIMGDSIQTQLLANTDELEIVSGETATYDILSNDHQADSEPLTVTQINGQDVVAGETVTLANGQQVTLNEDGSITVSGNGAPGEQLFTYTITDQSGNTDVGYIELTTLAPPPDGIVTGTADGDLIDADYMGDPEGDRVDNNDATGVQGSVGDDDVIHAGAGNDTVMAGAGNDSVLGGTGNDLIDGGIGDDLLEGEEGNDSLYGGGGDDTLLGGAGNDVLAGGVGSDRLYGGDDADRFIIGNHGGLDHVAGGEGGDDNDTLAFTGGAGVRVDVNGNESGSWGYLDGSNSFGSFTEIERITGTEHADEILGYSATSNMNVDGGAGNDWIEGGSGNDTILGGEGDDGIGGGAGDDSIDGGVGNDSIFGGDGNDTLTGGEGDDRIQAGYGNDTVSGGEGNDYIWGDPGDDIVHGDAGDDSVYGGVGNDEVYGGVGNDEVYGGYGDDTVYGGAGNDTITGSHGNDIAYGGDGDDLVLGAQGNDTLYGGAGNNTLEGGDDDDVIYGHGGDVVDGGEGVSWENGLPVGTDNDTLIVEDVEHIVWDPTNSENGVVHFNDGSTLTFFNIEHVIADGSESFPPNYVVEGTAGDDLIDAGYTGDPQGDRVDAGDNLAGNDDDRIEAGAGNDTVLAGAGNDTVYGGTGDDSLTGGTGNDVLYGGEGNDTIVLDSGQDTIYGGDDRDVIVIGAGAGPGSTIYGGAGGDDHDTLDLSAWGPDRVQIIREEGNDENGWVRFFDEDGNYQGELRFENIETIQTVVPCFTPGTRIVTSRGEVAVEEIRTGDMVLTRDSGYQPVRWIGSRSLTAAELIARPRLAPVRIAQGALGQELPVRNMMVSPQHRMLMTGVRAELCFGEHEVLVPALHLVDQPGITRAVPAAGVTYIHLMFDQHEVVLSDGCWSESFQPGEQTLPGLEEAQLHELLTLFPELRSGKGFAAARRSLKRHEVQVLLGA